MKFLHFLLFFLALHASVSFAQIGSIDYRFDVFPATSGTIFDIDTMAQGRILLSGYFNNFKGTKVNHIVRLYPDGTLDPSFVTPVGVNGTVYSTYVLPDGKILVAGAFTAYNGTTVNHIARLNSNGTLDESFKSGSGFNDFVHEIIPAPNGKFIVVGSFTSYNGVSAGRVVRINADGSMDNMFNSGTGANATVSTAYIQSDSKIVLGGDFTSFNGVTSNYLVRLLADGALDNTFVTATGFNKSINSITSTADNKLLIGGAFTSYKGQPYNCLIKLEDNGDVSSDFNLGTGIKHTGFLGLNSQYVDKLLPLPGGDVLVMGYFNLYNNVTRNDIVVINSQGIAQSYFSPSISNYQNAVVTGIVYHNDEIILGGNFITYNAIATTGFAKGKLSNGALVESFSRGTGPNANVRTMLEYRNNVLVAGEFTSYNGIALNRISWVDAYNGAPDLSLDFGSGFNSTVLFLDTLSDGRIVAAGYFTTYNGEPANQMVVLNTDGSIDHSFSAGAGFKMGTNTGSLNALKVISGDQILVAGYYSSYDSQPVSNVVRLNVDGSLDATFDVKSFDNTINCMDIQGDGKVLVGGRFSKYNSIAVSRLIRLNTDGSIDNSFNYNYGSSTTVEVVKVTADQKILVSDMNENASNYYSDVKRLNADGSVDFNFTYDHAIVLKISNATLLSDGSLLAGGTLPNFTSGTWISRLIKILPNGKVDTGLSDNVSIFHEVATCRKAMVLKDGGILVCGSFNNNALTSICKLYGLPFGYNSIKGKVFTDQNTNCILDAVENVLPNRVLMAQPGSFYAGTDKYGNYEMKVDSGTVSYTVSHLSDPDRAFLLRSQCPASGTYVINAAGSSNTYSSKDFVENILNCHLLTVDVQGESQRRICTKGAYYVNYRNKGNQAATGVTIEVNYPSLSVPLKSSPAWQSNQGHTLTYTIGTVNPNGSGTIVIYDSVACLNNPDPLLWTQCYRATILPVNSCFSTNPSWDGSSIDVQGSCDGKVLFNIINKGTGAMADSSSYRVYLNDTLIYTRKFKLSTASELAVHVNASGKTVRLEADQSPYHPYSDSPRQTVEACGNGTSFYPGLVTSVPMNADVPNTSAYCYSIRNSKDPNSKSAIPYGNTPANFIHSNDRLYYTIEFQNVGNDTAYQVTVVDTLSDMLDISSIDFEGSSFPYELSVTGKGKVVLTFNFYAINLTDSISDEAHSKGYLKYSIKPKSSLAEGSVIRNKAYIFFDYNMPIITNEVHHEINNQVPENSDFSNLVTVDNVVTGIDQSANSHSIVLYPNPAHGQVTFTGQSQTDYQLVLMDLRGMEVMNQWVSSGKVFSVTNLVDGVYIYQVKDLYGNFVSFGRLIKQ